MSRCQLMLPMMQPQRARRKTSSQPQSWQPPCWWVRGQHLLEQWLGAQGCSGPGLLTQDLQRLAKLAALSAGRHGNAWAHFQATLSIKLNGILLTSGMQPVYSF